jgi:hypothetical protein
MSGEDEHQVGIEGREAPLVVRVDGGPPALSRACERSGRVVCPAAARRAR